MKTKINYAFVIIFSIMTIGLTFAQKGVSVLQKGEKGLAPRFLKINQENKISKENYEKLLYDILKIDRAYQFVEVNTETDDLGINHLKVQQYLNGYPVENAFYIIHSKNGFILSANGEVFKVALVNKNRNFKSSGISPKEALQKAKNFMGGDAFLSEKVKNKSAFKKKEAKVYICKNNELDIANLRLAYKFDIYSKKPFNRKKVYIDFHSGNTVFAEALVLPAFEDEKSGSCKHYDKHEEGGQKVKSLAIAKTKTGYYGTKSIIASGSPGRYLASQTGKRNISITNLNGRTIGQSQSAPIGGSIISSSTPDGFGKSGNEAYYMAAYWGADRVWDLLKDEFGRNGYNNKGGEINIFVNASDKHLIDNALWYGTWVYFGNASKGTPFTPLDVVSHEIFHGVTATSAGLVNNNESGALNEGFSDIFGCYAEHYILNTLDNNTWMIAENISLDDVQRSLSNPKKYKDPDTYKGTNWYYGSKDQGGVHTNNGVLNHWFYILSQGKQGTNDKGSSYNVKGIGIKKAVQVAYRALTRYLTSSSNYSSARNAVISAATDLYGANSCELVATTDAMYAVGIGAKYSGSGCSTTNCAAVEDLIAGNITKSSAKINWTAKPGVTSYRLEYKIESSKAYTNIPVINSSSYNLSGLLANTSYQVRVTYTCNGQLAPYSTITNFRTKNNSEPPECNAVTGVKASDITQTSALINWTAKPGVTSYRLEYKIESSKAYTNIPVINSSSYNLSGLLANTSYQVRVTYTCNGQLAPYSTITNFRTKNNSEPPECNAVTGVKASDITQTSALINWTAKPGVTSYRLEYKIESFEGYRNIPVINGSSHNLSGLLANTSYQVRVTYTCNGQLAPYSRITNFRTKNNSEPLECNAVTGVKASEITQTSALINWTAKPGVTNYRLEYKKGSSKEISNISVNGSSYNLSGLLANTSYLVRVTYTCNGQLAPYSTMAHFRTKNNSEPPKCNAVTGVKASKIKKTSALINWTARPGVTSYRLEYKKGSSKAYSNISVNGSSYNLSGLLKNSKYNVRVKYICTNGKKPVYSTVVNFKTKNTGRARRSFTNIPAYQDDYKLSPNPYEGGEIKIELNKKTSSNVEIRVTDVSGKILFYEKKTPNTSKEIKIYVPQLNKPVYPIYFVSVNGLSKQLLVKNN